jgi:UDP-glucose 6-dehydrogenase
MKPVVGFVGMTHLGLVSASAVASAGFETICFDRDEALVAKPPGARSARADGRQRRLPDLQR